VKIGQEAVIKIGAYPFTHYGTIKGRVVRISQDAIAVQDLSLDRDTRLTVPEPNQSAAAPTPPVRGLVYLVTIALDGASFRSRGASLPLTPGMNVTVEVLTGKRRAINYLLAPLVEITSESGHER